jgi:hypothetical protein
MRINSYAHLIIIEILDEVYARAQNWSTVEYYSTMDRIPRYLGTVLWPFTQIQLVKIAILHVQVLYSAMVAQVRISGTSLEKIPYRNIGLHHGK